MQQREDLSGLFIVNTGTYEFVYQTWWKIKIHSMSKESCDIPGGMKRTAKTAGDTLDEATGKITGVQEVTVVRRDTMKTRPVAGIAGNPLKQTLTKTSQEGGMISKVRSDATHPIENTWTE